MVILFKSFDIKFPTTAPLMCLFLGSFNGVLSFCVWYYIKNFGFPNTPYNSTSLIIHKKILCSVSGFSFMSSCPYYSRGQEDVLNGRITWNYFWCTPTHYMLEIINQTQGMFKEKGKQGMVPPWQKFCPSPHTAGLPHPPPPPIQNTCISVSALLIFS